MRSKMIAMAAAIVLGTATMATGAMAAPHMGGHPGGGGFASPGGHPGGGFAFHGGPGFRGGVGGLYAFGGQAYYGGCWQRRLVPTPFGMRWRLVNVCY